LPTPAAFERIYALEGADGLEVAEHIGEAFSGKLTARVADVKVQVRTRRAAA
jgi:hypothetical protein